MHQIKIKRKINGQQNLEHHDPLILHATKKSYLKTINHNTNLDQNYYNEYAFNQSLSIIRVKILNKIDHLYQRFRGFLPIVVDVETSGLDPKRHGLLEIAMVLIDYQPNIGFTPGTIVSEHIIPHESAELDPKSLAFNKIDPYHPLRFAIPEVEALKKIFTPIKQAIKHHQCQRAVLVGHNAWFDLQFIQEAAMRHHIKSPFHPFTSFDTATLAGVIYGQTVLAKAMSAAQIEFNSQEAHSALYDAKKTAELFCKILNGLEQTCSVKNTFAS